MTWKWEKRLPHLGGSLIVTPSDFGTSVYFPGVDRRHNGTFWKMTSREAASFGAALDDAWKRFEQLTGVAPHGADMRVAAAMGITIHHATWPGRGITLHGIHSFISERKQVDSIIAELAGLPAIAANVQTALAGT
ncbi:hypothetical protein [Sphingomonas adhaesiva]|uniref:hypothetical protein n=1 Tax=Sphingomonas adhaesiva TaxID=28212 RepID=UPI002FF5758F